MILFLIGFFFLMVMAVVLIAPVIMLMNKSHLDKMEKLVSEFETKTFNNQEEKDKAKLILKKELINIKSKILNDTSAIAKAGDILNLI